MSQGLGLFTQAASGPSPVTTPITGDPASPYNEALGYLTQLVNEGIYGGETGAAVIDAFNNLQTAVGQMAPADTATVEATPEWSTLMDQSRVISADVTQFDRNVAGQAASSLIPIVQGLAANPASSTPAQTFTPPSNQGGFTPVQPVKAVGPAPLVASAAATATGGSTPSTSIVPTTTSTPAQSGPSGVQTSNTAPGTQITVATTPKPGFSVGATVFVALGALLLGGVLVYMFQPQLLGMRENPLPKKKRKRKKKS